MPLSSITYSFPSLPEQTYHGLPGMVADSLPDRFGNIVINRYLESQGRTADDLSVIEKLCYTGKRGMGALEYEPSQEIININEKVDLDALTKLASEILSEKEKIHIEKNDNLMAQLMECGSSVGGGNTFDKIRKCNFDKDIIDYVKAGVTYIGGSAGAHIATKNIEHVLKYDDNNVEMTDFNGLGFFDGVILCHYTYHRKADFDELCKTSKHKAYYLTDSDSIVYEG